jgi:hypothetical protein
VAGEEELDRRFRADGEVKVAAMLDRLRPAVGTDGFDRRGVAQGERAGQGGESVGEPASTWASIGSPAARSTAAASSFARPCMGRALADDKRRRHTGGPGSKSDTIRRKFHKVRLPMRTKNPPPRLSLLSLFVPAGRDAKGRGKP